MSTLTQTAAKIQLSINYNNCASNDPCAICGGRTDPIIGPELFLSDSWGLVCHSCGETHAPELIKALALCNEPRSELYARVFKNAGELFSQDYGLVQKFEDVYDQYMEEHSGDEFLLFALARGLETWFRDSYIIPNAIDWGDVRDE